MPNDGIKRFYRLFGILLGLKLAYVVGISILAYMFPSMDMRGFSGSMQCWPREGGPIFTSHYATWDAAHYLYLSEVGYSSGARACAFYPLWPLSMRWFAVFTGGNHVISGMVLANIFSAVGWAIFYLVTERRFGEKVARLALLLLTLFPGGLFFQFPYTESLFFLLLMLLWLGLEIKHTGLIVVSAFLLPMTRAVGIFCIFPMAWSLLSPLGKRLITEWQGQTGSGRSSPTASVIFWEGLEKSWVLFAPLLGWITYFALMRIWTGNPFEGFEAQKYWGVQSISNLFNVPKFFLSFFFITNLHAFTGSLLDRCIFLLFALSLRKIRTLGRDLFIWALVLGLVPAMSGCFVSYTRFCSVVFPLFIGLAVYLAANPLELKRYLITFSVLHLLLLWWFVNFRWAG